MINYLLSGIDKEKGFNEVQAKYLKKDIKNTNVITFIASTFSDIEKTNMYLDIMIKWFKNIGITFKEAYLINDLVNPSQAKEYIDKSDVVFIMGGDTLEQIKNINKYNIIPNLQNRKGITIGISAGSINMANNVAIARDIDDNIPDHSFYKGIGLVDINIEPHFDLNNTFHNQDIIEISKDNKMICLPDDSFIRIDKDINIIGEYYMYDREGNLHKNGNIAILTDENFGLESIAFNNPRVRIGARGIIINDNKIALFNKVNKNEYKLPGGGVESGESIKAAFKREILEETGCEIEIKEELGTIEEHKSLDNFKQISHVFVGKVKKDLKKLNLTQKEQEEGARLIWTTPKEALKLITNCADNLKESKYENIYHTKFIILRDKIILEYYLSTINE